jgi:hypothetical protein
MDKCTGIKPRCPGPNETPRHNIIKLFKYPDNEGGGKERKREKWDMR